MRFLMALTLSLTINSVGAQAVATQQPDVIFVPVPALSDREAARGIALIALTRLLATYSVPFGARARPVGPITSAAGSVRCGKPDPTLVMFISRGGFAPLNIRSKRRIVPVRTTLPPAAVNSALALSTSATITYDSHCGTALSFSTVTMPPMGSSPCLMTT